jgi:uncharacterized protein (DUF1800 family)
MKQKKKIKPKEKRKKKVVKTKYKPKKVTKKTIGPWMSSERKQQRYEAEEKIRKSRVRELRKRFRKR